MMNLVKSGAGNCRWVCRGVFCAAGRAISSGSRRDMAISMRTPPAKGLLSKVPNCVSLRNYSSSTMKIATYEEVKALCNQPEKLLIDVREPNELLETGSIPTSINIPLGQVQTIFSDDTSNEEFRERFGRTKPSKDSPVIFMCKVGIRSDKAAQTVTQMGFSNSVEESLKMSNEDFKAKFGRDKPTKEQEVIFNCRSGGRAGKATDIATALGFVNAKNYKGSWTEWAEKEGLPAPK